MTANASRLLLAAILTGILVGLTVAGFEWLTTELVLHALLERPTWQLALAPGVGLVTCALLLRWVAGGAGPSTSDEYVREFHARSPRLPIRQMPGKLLAGVATIGSGGALGLEGPSVYAGSTLGLEVSARLRRWLALDDARLLLSAGAAAGIAAVFQTPATGVIFALESPYKDDVARRALLPALLASAASYITFVVVLQPEDALPVLGLRPGPIEATELIGAAILGVLAGLFGRGTAWMVTVTKEIVGRVRLRYRIVVAATVLAALVVVSEALFEAPLSLGPGIQAIEWVTDPERSLTLIAALFVVRILATLSTLGGSGSGGLFIPLVVQGVILGRFVGGLLPGTEASSSLWPTLGLAAFLGAGYRAPIAAVMFVAESTSGDSYVVPALIAAAVSQLVAGSTTVASGQRSARIGHLEGRLQLPIVAVMSTDELTVPPDAALSEFMDLHVLGRRRRTVAVVDGDTYLGTCSLADVATVERERWEITSVAEVMRTDAPTGRPGWTLKEAVAAMERNDLDVLAVTDESGTFVGIVDADEVVRLDQILDETDPSSQGTE
ncbi:chloride channel protein [Actinomarinicola tropica]|uniref:CBS domain-containing protein n=1 Tax=Actinomarinicola tropica TaxID=2789776 RepID=A0A5Q2RL83_9ACTN|nr:chloride channel protein [Actinomarinicola tropica]QGG95331.1 CBS domain-containing protein [Actinomarinicola tropica]